MKHFEDICLQYDPAGIAALIVRPGVAKCPKVVSPPGTRAPFLTGRNS